MIQLCYEMLSAVSSNADMECTFTTFGLVHFELGNWPGTDKTGNLVSIWFTSGKNSIKYKNCILVFVLQNIWMLFIKTNKKYSIL